MDYRQRADRQQGYSSNVWSGRELLSLSPITPTGTRRSSFNKPSPAHQYRQQEGLQSFPSDAPYSPRPRNQTMHAPPYPMSPSIQPFRSGHSPDRSYSSRAPPSREAGRYLNPSSQNHQFYEYNAPDLTRAIPEGAVHVPNEGVPDSYTYEYPVSGPNGNDTRRVSYTVRSPSPVDYFGRKVSPFPPENDDEPEPRRQSNIHNVLNNTTPTNVPHRPLGNNNRIEQDDLHPRIHPHDLPVPETEPQDQFQLPDSPSPYNDLLTPTRSTMTIPSVADIPASPDSNPMKRHHLLTSLYRVCVDASTTYIRGFLPSPSHHHHQRQQRRGERRYHPYPRPSAASERALTYYNADGGKTLMDNISVISNWLWEKARKDEMAPHREERFAIWKMKELFEQGEAIAKAANWRWGDGGGEEKMEDAWRAGSAALRFCAWLDDDAAEDVCREIVRDLEEGRGGRERGDER